MRVCAKKSIWSNPSNIAALENAKESEIYLLDKYTVLSSGTFDFNSILPVSAFIKLETIVGKS